MNLRGKTIVLRALEPDDLETLYRWENNTEVWEVSGTTVPFSRHLLSEFIKRSDQDIYINKQLRLMIELTKNKKAIGCIDLFEFDPLNRRAGIGILIADEKERRKGYASESLEIIVSYCFGTLGLHQIFAHVLKENSSSVNLFLKSGFEVSGIKKDWILSGKKWKPELHLQLINS